MAINDVYEVLQTPQAEEHIRNISYYIAVKLSNPGAANNFLDEVDALDDYLSQSPQKCGFTDIEPWDKIIRVTKIHNYSYYAYFWVDEEEYKVYIIGYSYMGQDQNKFLSSLDI